MKNIILLCFIVLCLGCAHHSASNKRLGNDEALLVTGKCVDPVKFKSGGKLGILAFKAGPQAEANEQLDRISSLLVKGIQESLEHSKAVLEITNDESKADLVLEGYVEEFYQPGRLSQFMLWKKDALLSVSGEIWQKAKGTKMLTFASSKKISSKKIKINEEAYQMGLSIGKFIVDQLTKE